MTSIQKNVIFLISILLLLPVGAFAMEEKNEGFFAKLFGKTTTKSKEYGGNVSNKKLSNEASDFKMVDMKQVALKKQKALEDWVLMDDAPLEEHSSGPLKNSKEGFEMDDMVEVAAEKDKDLMNWETVDESDLEEYDENNIILSNDPKKLEEYRVKKIEAIFEEF